MATVEHLPDGRACQYRAPIDVQAKFEIERARSARQLIGATFALYRRYPWLFLVLAAVVVIPYQLFARAVTGASPLGGNHISLTASLLITVTNTSLVGPLISALHVHGVLDVREGATPRLRSIGWRSLKVLPVVSAAVIISWLGMTLGFLALIVPGIILALRWVVVPQAAALEGEGWTDALQRSRALTRTHYSHIIGALLLTSLVVDLPFFAIDRAFAHSSATAASFALGTALQILVRSFSALVTALLFFDLSARFESEPQRTEVESGPTESVALSGRVVEPTGHPLDPDSYSDEDRPRGWYVIPDKPWRMRYWAADGKPGWSKRTAKTPKETQAGWYKVKGR